jgi:hypothetical protein
VAATPPAPAARPAAPREAPAAATQILVKLASDPPGAIVTDARRGVVIGATPFEQRFDRKSASLGVRLAKDGFANVDMEIPLGADFEKSVRLERQAKSRAPVRTASASGKKMASAGGGSTPAANAGATNAPSTTPPPATTTPTATKPKAEKW